MFRRALCIGLGLLVGCSSSSSDDDGGGTAVSGQTLYERAIEGGNTFACSTCHALTEPAQDGFRRPGHPIGDAARRPSYKNGQIATFREAVNTCLTEWMGFSAGWAADDARWVALSGYLEEQAGTTDAPALSFEIVQPPADVSGGDVGRGMTLFNESCAVCHGMDARGSQQAPPLSGEFLDPMTIARRIRTSGLQTSTTYEGLTGGRMPFWAADRISESELLDLVAFVDALETRAPVDAGVAPDSGAGGQNCGMTSAKIGQTAMLRTRSHQVSGTARIVDDCTIRFEMFNFDGQGINVRVYGGLGGNYRAGFQMEGQDLRRSPAWSNETFDVQLPANRTMNDLDGVSIWCVPSGSASATGCSSRELLEGLGGVVS